MAFGLKIVDVNQWCTNAHKHDHFITECRLIERVPSSLVCVRPMSALLRHYGISVMLFQNGNSWTWPTSLCRHLQPGILRFFVLNRIVTVRVFINDARLRNLSVVWWLRKPLCDCTWRVAYSLIAYHIRASRIVFARPIAYSRIARSLFAYRISHSRGP